MSCLHSCVCPCMCETGFSSRTRTFTNSLTATSTADPVRAFAIYLVLEIACMPPICLSNHAVGTSVFAHHWDSRATPACPIDSEPNLEKGNRCKDPVSETMLNCGTNVLVTENLLFGKEHAGHVNIGQVKSNCTPKWQPCVSAK